MIKLNDERPPSGEFIELLQLLLAPIRRVHETPLQFEIDSRGLAKIAWEQFFCAHPVLAEKAAEHSAEVLNNLEKVMTCAVMPSSTASIRLHTNLPITNRIEIDLANWLDILFQNVRAIDPDSIEILGLRIEGLDDRAIAGKMGLGLRLVGRIVDDICSSMIDITRKKEATKC